MKLSKNEYISLLLVISSFLVSIIVYPQLPEQMASHWNIKGDVDGYFGRFWGAFLLPLINIGIYILLVLVPRIDPLKDNITRFRRYYDLFFIAIIGFFIYIHLLTLLWNLGIEFNLLQFLSPAIALLIYLAGTLMEHAKRNYMVGIRTPWTLSSDIVWDKTHRLGSRLFKISAVIILVAIVFPDWLILLLLVPLLSAALYLIVYSYFEYRKIG
jgi:uncharacterized membrane protein